MFARIAKRLLGRLGYVVLSDAEFRVTLRVCEDSARKLQRLYSPKRRPYGAPQPAREAHQAVSQLARVLREVTNGEA